MTPLFPRPLLNLAFRPAKDRTPYPFPRMSRGLGIRKVALAQIILVLVNNEGAAQKILRPNIGNQIAISARTSTGLLNIPEIPCMSWPLRSGLGAVILGRTDVKMLTRPQTTFPS